MSSFDAATHTAQSRRCRLPESVVACSRSRGQVAGGSVVGGRFSPRSSNCVKLLKLTSFDLDGVTSSSEHFGDWRNAESNSMSLSLEVNLSEGTCTRAHQHMATVHERTCAPSAHQQQEHRHSGRTPQGHSGREHSDKQSEDSNVL